VCLLAQHQQGPEATPLNGSKVHSEEPLTTIRASVTLGATEKIFQGLAETLHTLTKNAGWAKHILPVIFVLG
jgi:hypothetical protein